MRVVIATKNKGKLREFKQLLGDLKGIEWAPDSLVEELPEVVEDGKTFEENAIKKAKETAIALQCYALADDSGLEVDALGGAPGVYSKRFAGPTASDEDNNEKLLKLLQGKTHSSESLSRNARFRAVLALASPQGEALATTSGACEGHIAESPQGEGGFGYDPIFIPKGHEQTTAQLSTEAKNALSHRGKAAREMRTQLAQLVSG